MDIVDPTVEGNTYLIFHHRPLMDARLSKSTHEFRFTKLDLSPQLAEKAKTVMACKEAQRLRSKAEDGQLLLGD